MKMSNSVVMLNRRHLLTGSAALGAGLLLPGCARGDQDRAAAGGSSPRSGDDRGSNKPDVDSKIMTFALNLEYMEAEYYTRGAYGHSLQEHGIETGRNPGTVRGGHKVQFSSRWFQDHAEELAFNEAAHVQFYRKHLGNNAVDLPAIDFEAGFNAAAQAAGIVREGEYFDPFADDLEVQAVR